MGRGPNRKLHVMTSSNFSEKRYFFWDNDNLERRIRSRGLGEHVTWILLKGKDLNHKLKRFPKLSKLAKLELSSLASMASCIARSTKLLWDPSLPIFLSATMNLNFFRSLASRRCTIPPNGRHLRSIQQRR